MQRYHLIREFHPKPGFVPPLTLLAYFYYFIRYLIRKMLKRLHECRHSESDDADQKGRHGENGDADQKDHRPKFGFREYIMVVNHILTRT